jgi:hypothetical protein
LAAGANLAVGPGANPTARNPMEPLLQFLIKDEEEKEEKREEE